MSSNDPAADGFVSAPMPADVEAPDKVFYGLTFRQLAILAVAAVILTLAWRGAYRLIPTPLLLIAGILVGGLVLPVAVGRRDGLPLDVWLSHALRFSRKPRALTTSETAATTPPWVAAPERRAPLPAPLRLPASAIAEDGEITLGDHTAAIVAATTINLALRTGDEQAALIGAFGRWLNSLTAAAQIVVSAQPVDLQSHADALAEQAGRLAHSALADACANHAAFLSDLATRRDPLRRQLLITSRTPTGPRHGSRRQADDTARALSELGVNAKALEGPAATAALAGCADPYRTHRPGGLAPPDTVITASAMSSRRRRLR
jgi:hypothetical protein